MGAEARKAVVASRNNPPRDEPATSTRAIL